MMRELVTLYLSDSDIGRLLGTLVLLSLGITLTLWGLQRRKSGVVVLVLSLCLAVMVPTVLAIELPPSGSVAQIQTNGPNALLDHGDWYTSRSPDAGGPGYHSFEIYVPCTVPAGQVITVELFDPESNNTGAGDPDEIMGASSDNTTFTLMNPSGSVAATTTYTPGGGTSQSWVIFTTFTPGANGCGIYRLTTTTSDNDEQGWKLRVTPDNPDGTPGTGDEISLGTLETSFQHTGFGCQTFHFFVPITLSIRLSNFDMDNAGTVTYTTPSANHPTSTVSGDRVWNSSISYTYPPPGGDEISNPESGWWQATLCVDSGNQYVFDTGGLPYFYEKPATPDMAISKDDGTAAFSPDGVLTYTITYTNAGPGAALDAVLTDTIPLSTTYLSCGGGLSCGYVPPPPGSGIVTFSLGTIISGASGSVWVSVHVDPNVPSGTITNTVDLDYSDIIFSDYPTETATDPDQYVAPTPTPVPPTPTPTPTSPKREPPEPAPTPTPPPTATAAPAPTPTVEVLAVAVLPETGGLPGWCTVVPGVPIIIGVAGLLSLALLEMRWRRGDGKRD